MKRFKNPPLLNWPGWFCVAVSLWLWATTGSVFLLIFVGCCLLFSVISGGSVNDLILRFTVFRAIEKHFVKEVEKDLVRESDEDQDY